MGVHGSLGDLEWGTQFPRVQKGALFPNGIPSSLENLQGDAKFPGRTDRHYAIPHVTKRKTDSGRKSRYYAAILSDKEERDLWHFGSSLRQRGM